DDDDLQESTLRNISAVVLMSRIVDRGRKIQQTNDIKKKLDLMASQNSHLAGLIWSMTQFIKSQK
ncbi:MAG: hypothetical protein CMM10_07925, partial [Rhodospirillaceae bacterium]|nr:hypothetical protein [Rhodospirillaceae bacterium]